MNLCRAPLPGLGAAMAETMRRQGVAQRLAQDALALAVVLLIDVTARFVSLLFVAFS